MELAFENSHRIRNSEYLADQARSSSSRADARRWPTVSVTGRYDFSSEVTTIDVPAGPEFPEKRIRLGDENRYSLSAGVEVPVFTGGSLSAKARAERAGATAAEHDLEAERQRTTRDVRAAFFTALGAQAREEAARVARERLSRHLDRLRGQVQVGAASREMLLQAQARLAEAEQKELALQEELASSQLVLGSAIGMPGQRIQPEGQADETLLLDLDIARAGVEEKPELAAMASQHEQSKERIRAVEGSLLPSVMANAYVNYGRPGVDLVDNNWMSWTSAGISVSWLLWDWWARSEEVDAAKAASMALEARLAQLRRELETSLAIAKTRLELATARMHKANERAGLERQRLDLVEGRYDQGMASETELLDAHDDLAEAEASAVSSLALVRISEVGLLYAVGR